ncbi:MAG: ABC transporter permease [Verrucomicrobia bacterium]|nr:ABC transporter permease [Verrucomicrobiota bacterium]
MLNDLRFAVRQLLKNPGFTAVAVLVLALGIAGNIVAFSFYNSFFLRPFPFREADRLVDLDETAPRWNLEYTGLSYLSFDAWRRESRCFQSMGAWAGGAYNLATRSSVERVSGARVTHDLAAVLGLQPVLGRFFTPEEDRPGGAKVVVLGQRLWQRLFGGADILGQSLRLDQDVYTIVGVLPKDTSMLENTDLWVPLAENSNSQDNWYLSGAGRLKPGATLAQAREELRRVHRSLIDQRKATENTFPRLSPLSERYFGPARLVIDVFLSAALLVLVIAGGNVAALMLARGLARSREFGVRLALGATGWSVARLIGIEALLVSGLGGVLGACLGFWGLRALLAALGGMLPGWLHFDFDWRVGLFILLLVLAVGCLGALPTIRSALGTIRPGALQSSAQQSTVSIPRRRALNALVVAELAITVVVTIQAGLLVQAFRWLQRADPGYRPANVLLYELALPAGKYGSPEARVAFFRNHLEAVRHLPGVMDASAVSAPPLGEHWGTFFDIEHAAPRRPQDPDPVVLQRIAFPGYFETMGIRLLKGRTFTERDGLNEGALAVVVNELFVQQFWPNQEALGKRIRSRGSNRPWMTVVGVVHDVKHYGMDRPMIPGVYLPYAQMPLGQMSVVVRAAGPPATILPAVRALLRQTDPELPVFGVATLQERLTRSIWLRRLYSALIGILAGAALLMAMGGIFGVFSYVVGRRNRELAIRLALGASPKSVGWLVLRQGLRLVLTGVGIGLALALATTPLMRSLLFGVSSSDPLTFGAIAVLLGAVALLACWVPAWRATRIHPMEALRCE